jgi:hypothetical protein
VGSAFAGWATEPEGEAVYADKGNVKNLSLEQGAKVTLYAVWTTRDWTVSDYLNTGGMEFTFSGDAGWIPDTSTSHDGIASLRSGAIGASAAYPERTESTVKTTVVGAGAGSFWWKVDCEEMDEEFGEWYDYAVFLIDGKEIAKIAGDSGWQKVDYVVSGAGEHVLSWTFTRDDYDEEGVDWENAAWLDELVWTPKPVTVSFDGGDAIGEPPEKIVKYEGCEISLPGLGTLQHEGGYGFKGWSDGESVYPAGSTYVVGSVDVVLTAIWELKIWTFGEAMDADGMTFEAGGDALWTVDTTVGFTNAVSMKSGSVASGQSSWLQTTVSGAGTLAFRWKVFGGMYRNNPFAYAKVELDGTEYASVYFTNDWAEVSIPVSGTEDHTIRWTYLRTSSRAADGDCAWLDEVVWTPVAFPELDASASSETVTIALNGAADAKLSENIKTVEEYSAFRYWAMGLSGSTLLQVKESPNAWLSYALDTDTLIEGEVTEDRLKVASFRQIGNNGLFLVKMRLEGVDIGDGATTENLLRIFAVEGAEKLEKAAFSVKNVVVYIVQPNEGMVAFIVAPRNKGASYFFRARMREDCNGDGENGVIENPWYSDGGLTEPGPYWGQILNPYFPDSGGDQEPGPYWSQIL